MPVIQLSVKTDAPGEALIPQAARLIVEMRPAYRMEEADVVVAGPIPFDLVNGLPAGDITLLRPPPGCWWHIVLQKGNGARILARDVVFPEGVGPFDFADLIDIDPLSDDLDELPATWHLALQDLAGRVSDLEGASGSPGDGEEDVLGLAALDAHKIDPDAHAELFQVIVSAFNSLSGTVAGKASPADVTAAIQTAIDALVTGAPGALDTLNELAAALGDDPAFATSVSTALANRIRFDAAQVLTEPQKTQARANTGSAAASALSTLDGQVVKSVGTRGLEVVTESMYDAMELAGTLAPNTLYAKIADPV